MTIQHIAVFKNPRHYRRPSYPQRRLDELPERVRFVIESVCERYSVPTRVLMGRDRHSKTNDCRRECYVILRRMNWRGGRPSLPQIGRWMGRDHTSVLHGLRRYEELMARELAA